jgi:hypothetical protein
MGGRHPSESMVGMARIMHLRVLDLFPSLRRLNRLLRYQF